VNTSLGGQILCDIVMLGMTQRMKRMDVPDVNHPCILNNFIVGTVKVTKFFEKRVSRSRVLVNSYSV